jgi:methylated-DNA-[protein]-cysteine S-methyltransferase
MRGLGYYSSPVGELLIESDNDKIITVNFLRDSKSEESRNTVIDQCIEELDEYFFRGRKFFTVELELRGSDFQKSVWNELIAIPFGTTISYEALAIRIGNIKSIRAVGLANGQNPIAIIVPCHRGDWQKRRSCWLWRRNREQRMVALSRRHASQTTFSFLIFPTALFFDL